MKTRKTTMKSIIGIIGLLAIGGVAQAEPSYEFCGKISDLSGQIMESRQIGVPLKEVIATTDNEHLRKIALEAWKAPRWETEERQRSEITDFSDEMYQECLQATGD